MAEVVANCDRMGDKNQMTGVSVDIVPIQQIQGRILIIRDHKVLIDADLADLYGVQTKRLNEQVKRNRERFPEDFMFQLSETERDEVVANCDHLKRLKYSPGRPYAFTEHGAIMAASVLNTRQAVQVSVYVVRAFVQLRRLLTSHRDLARRLRQIERRLQKHDQCIIHMAEALNQLMPPPNEKPKRPIGFKTEAE